MWSLVKVMAAFHRSLAEVRQSLNWWRIHLPDVTEVWGGA